MPAAPRTCDRRSRSLPPEVSCASACATCAVASRHHARDGGGVLRRHLRAELPDDDGADGDARLRQGSRRVRHPRFADRRRIARGLAPRRAPACVPPAPRHRLRGGASASPRSSRARCRPSWRSRSRCRSADLAALDDDHRGQRVRADDDLARGARPRDGDLHDDLHGRYAVRRAGARVDRGPVRGDGGRCSAVAP